MEQLDLLILLSSTPDDTRLRQLGYKPQLKRRFTYFQCVTIMINVFGCVGMIPGMLSWGWKYGAPMTMVVGWPVVSIGAYMCTLSLSELASAYPTSAGLHYITFQLADPRWRCCMSWITAFLNFIARIALVATTTYLVSTATFLLVESFTPFKAGKLGTYLGFLSMMLVQDGMACWGKPDTIPRVMEMSLYVQVSALLVFIVVLPILAPQRNGIRYLFETANCVSGGVTCKPSNTVTGMMCAAWVLMVQSCGIDLMEEIIGAELGAPLSLLLASSTAGLLGWIMILALCICVPRSKLMHANSKIYFDIVYNVFKERFYHPEIYTWALLGVVPTAAYYSGLAMLYCSSRMVFAMSRDGLLPFSHFFCHVDEKSQAPNRAVHLMSALCALVMVPSIWYEGYVDSLTRVGVIFILVSSAIPILARTSNSGDTFKAGVFRLGRAAYLIHISALAFCALSLMNMIVLPSISTGTPDRVVLAAGAIAAGLGILWLLVGRLVYKGPNVCNLCEEHQGANALTVDNNDESMLLRGLSHHNPTDQSLRDDDQAFVYFDAVDQLFSNILHGLGRERVDDSMCDEGIHAATPVGNLPLFGVVLPWLKMRTKDSPTSPGDKAQGQNTSVSGSPTSELSSRLHRTNTMAHTQDYARAPSNAAHSVGVCSASASRQTQAGMRGNDAAALPSPHLRRMSTIHHWESEELEGFWEQETDDSTESQPSSNSSPRRALPLAKQTSTRVEPFNRELCTGPSSLFKSVSYGTLNRDETGDDSKQDESFKLSTTPSVMIKASDLEWLLASNTDPDQESHPHDPRDASLLRSTSARRRSSRASTDLTSASNPNQDIGEQLGSDTIPNPTSKDAGVSCAPPLRKAENGEDRHESHWQFPGGKHQGSVGNPVSSALQGAAGLFKRRSVDILVPAATGVFRRRSQASAEHDAYAGDGAQGAGVGALAHGGVFYPEGVNPCDVHETVSEKLLPPARALDKVGDVRHKGVETFTADASVRKEVGAGARVMRKSDGLHRDLITSKNDGLAQDDESALQGAASKGFRVDGNGSPEHKLMRSGDGKPSRAKAKTTGTNSGPATDKEQHKSPQANQEQNWLLFDMTHDH